MAYLSKQLFFSGEKALQRNRVSLSAINAGSSNFRLMRNAARWLAGKCFRTETPPDLVSDFARDLTNKIKAAPDDATKYSDLQEA